MCDKTFIWPIMCLDENQGMNTDCDYLNNFSEEIKYIYREYDTFFCVS